MYWSNYISFWDDFLDPLLITIDGDNRLIIVNPIQLWANGQAKTDTTTNGSTIRAKQDIYSASKRWLQRRQNLDYLSPMRAIGGDSVSSGQYAGDIYFITNNYRIQVNQQITITGTIYNDVTTTSPYLVNPGGGVIATVSSLAYAYTTSGVSVPTAAAIAAEVWNTASAPFVDPATIAGKINENSTTSKNILAVTV